MIKTQKLKISDFCQTGSGTTPSRSKLDIYYGGDIPWVKSGELRESIINETEEFVTEAALRETSLKLVPKGALLVAMYGATVGRVGLLGIAATTNQAVCHIIPNPEIADTRYLFHNLQFLSSYFISRGSGGAQPNISQQLIKETEIPLPPLEEQKRIAAILDQADALRKARRRAIERLNELSQSIFYEMFGDPKSNSKMFPVKPLGQLCDVRDGTHDSPVYVEDGFPLLTSKNFTSGRIDFEGARKISEKDYIQINKRSKVDVGDIVMPMIGTIGSPVIIDEEPSFAIKNVALIKFNKSPVKASYIHALLSSPYLEQIVGSSKRGGTQKFVALGDLRKLPIPEPPEPLQKAFEEKINYIKVNYCLADEHFNKLDTLFNSLQKRAFRGELSGVREMAQL